MLNNFVAAPQKLKDVEPIIRIEEVDGSELAQEFSDEIEKMLGSKMKSVKVSELAWNMENGINFFFAFLQKQANRSAKSTKIFKLK